MNQAYSYQAVAAGAPPIGWSLTSMLTLGDNVYQNGTAAEFTNCCNPTWGRHKARTLPSPGNHDYYVLRPDARREAANDTTFGVLKLTLSAGSCSWNFLPVAGQTFTDSGTTACH